MRSDNNIKDSHCYSKVVLITGGVGGAKLAEGLAAILPPSQLSIIGNIGDDDEFHGLWISPDIDTLTYTLAGIVNRTTGWGIACDTFHNLDAFGLLGRDTWMRLGDRDLATHIFRTEQRHLQRCPAEIALDIAERLGVKHPILLPTSQCLKTRIETPQGSLSMQEYFVRERYQPRPTGITYAGSSFAIANVAALRAIDEADVLIFSTSNPLLSIGPTLAVTDIYEAIQHAKAYRVAVSPLVGGQALSGPTCTILQACGYSADLAGIASYYATLIDCLVIDQEDKTSLSALSHTELDIFSQNIVMYDRESRISVARELLQNISSSLM